MADKLVNIFEKSLDEQSGTPRPKDDEIIPDEDLPADTEDDTDDLEDPEEADDSEGDLEEDPAEPTIAPPSGMSTDDQTHFATLTPEMQHFMVQREADRNAHFTRQTDEVATQRKAAEADRSQYQSQITELSQQLQLVIQDDLAPPDISLRDADPVKYDNDMAVYVNSLHQQKQAERELSRLQNLRNNELVRHAGEEAGKAAKLIPELGDTVKGPVLSSRISSYGVSQGYTTQEMGAAGSRDILMVYKAMQFDQLKSKGKTAAKKTSANKTAPKTIRAAGSRQLGAPANDKFQQLRKQVRKTGSDAAMSNVFEHMLENE